MLLTSNALIQLRLPLLLCLTICTTIPFHAHVHSATTEDLTESLLSLPYAQYVKTEKNPEKIGTTIYKKDKAFPGYNIYTLSKNNDIFVNLIDMDGTLIHSWVINNERLPWKAITPFPNGSIFFNSQSTGAAWEQVDVNSHILSSYNIPEYTSHHACYCLKEGGFLGLVRNTLSVPFKDLQLKITNHALVHVSPEGKILKTILLNKLFENDQGYQKYLKQVYDRRKEYKADPSKRMTQKIGAQPFHANNIENLEWDIPGIAKKGDWLVTIRNLDRVIIVDPEQEKIVWQWGENNLSMPHHATFLKEDQILLFDNGVRENSSRVIVVNMRSKKIIWQYGQQPGQKFFSRALGSVQRLPNGNTLIADSHSGRAFEVTASGEIVWEWYADFYAERKNKKARKTIYRISRVPYNFFKGVKFNYGKIQP